MYTPGFKILASRAHVEEDRQEINKQVGFNRIVPGPPRTRTHTQTERIRQHVNTAKGKPKLIAETLRKWSSGWYVFYRWRLNRIAIFIILREMERESRRDPHPVPLCCPQENDECCPRERVQVSVSMYESVHLRVCLSPSTMHLYTQFPFSPWSVSITSI